MSTTQINLSWTDNSNNETGFVLERSTDGTNFSPIMNVLVKPSVIIHSRLILVRRTEPARRRVPYK